MVVHAKRPMVAVLVFSSGTDRKREVAAPADSVKTRGDAITELLPGPSRTRGVPTLLAVSMDCALASVMN